MTVADQAGLAARGRGGKRLEALSRFFRIVPVAHRDVCAALDEFARFVGGALAAVVTQDKHFGVRNGLAD